MTQLEKFLALYEEFGIKLDRQVNEDGNTVLTMEAKSCPKVDGYLGFFTEVKFDSNGDFIEQGIWE